MKRTLHKRFPKNLKDFANKRQVKHTSTVLEHSIPFRTLVKLVDAEDKINDKILTHDLTLEVNNITEQLQTQTLDSSPQEQLMFTQPRDPNNENKPAYQKCCSYCHRTNRSISPCFKKQRDDEDKKNAYARSKSPQKSFVQYFRSSSNDRTKRYDTRYRTKSTSRKSYYTKNNNSQNRYHIALHLEIDLVMTRVLLLHNTLNQDITIIKETRDLTVLFIDPLTNNLIDAILVTDSDHAHIQEITVLQDAHLLLDHLQHQEILNFLDLAHTQKQERNLIQYKHKLKMIQINLKYICITQSKWQTL